MTHLYIELNTGLTEEVNSSIISKLYELAISGDLDNTSDLKGRLHSSTAKEKHVTYLNNNFDDLYISADTQYISFDDPDVETLMKRYIGTDDGVSLLDIQTFVNSGKAFGDGYTNTHTNRSGSFCENNEEKALINTFDEINLFNGITSIGTLAFSASGLTSIQLPSSITTLGSSSFSFCTSLTTITGLSNVTSLENGVFFNCSNLEDIDLNFENLTSLGLLAFYNCTSCQFGDLNLSSITTIEKEIFRQCTGITKLTLNDNVTVSGDNAFWHCTNITLADLGSGITFTSNGHSMFAGCTGLTTVTGMSDVTTIPRFMFADCTNLSYTDIDWTKITGVGQYAFEKTSSLAISNLSIPNLTTLNSFAFRNSGIISISDLGSITIVPDSCFNNCKRLVSVDMPSTITSIGVNAFLLAISLSTVICRATTPPALGNVDAFLGTSTSLNIYVPDASVSAYQSAANWSTYSSKIKGISQLPS